MPPFLFISATVHFAPSTSLTASADRLPVMGSMNPIFTGVSPRALMMNGPASWRPPTAAVAARNLRRLVVGLTVSFICFLPRFIDEAQVIGSASTPQTIDVAGPDAVARWRYRGPGDDLSQAADLAGAAARPARSCPLFDLPRLRRDRPASDATKVLPRRSWESNAKVATSGPVTPAAE